MGGRHVHPPARVLPIDTFRGTPDGARVAAVATAPGGLTLPPDSGLGGTVGGPRTPETPRSTYAASFGGTPYTGDPPAGRGAAAWPAAGVAGVGLLRPPAAAAVGAVLAARPSQRVPVDALLLATTYNLVVWQTPLWGSSSTPRPRFRFPMGEWMLGGPRP